MLCFDQQDQFPLNNEPSLAEHPGFLGSVPNMGPIPKVFFQRGNFAESHPTPVSSQGELLDCHPCFTIGMRFAVKQGRDLSLSIADMHSSRANLALCWDDRLNGVLHGCHNLLPYNLDGSYIHPVGRYSTVGRVCKLNVEGMWSERNVPKHSSCCYSLSTKLCSVYSPIREPLTNSDMRTETTSSP